MKKIIIIGIILIIIIALIIGIIIDNTCNSHGFAGWFINIGVQYQKFQVSTVEELVEALQNKENIEIEILNDLDLGWKKIYKNLINHDNFTKANEAKISPDLIESGVSNFILDKYKNVKIYSKNNSKILHSCLQIKNSNNVKIEGLIFVVLWEWDEITNGAYKENNWDFIDIENSDKIWINKCEFGQSYDGIIDSNASSNITISNCEINPNKYNYSFYEKQFDYLEKNKDQNRTYSILRDEAGLTKEQIMNIYNCQCKVYNFGTKEFEEDNAKQNITIHNVNFKNVKSRIPRIRAGKVHIYNICIDNSELKDYYDYINEEKVIELKNTYKDMIYDINRGVLSTEGAIVTIENSVFKNVDKPILESVEEHEGKEQYKGKVVVKNCMFNNELKNTNLNNYAFEIPYFYILKKVKS